LEHFFERANALALALLTIHPDNELDHGAKLLAGPPRSGSFCRRDEGVYVDPDAAVGELDRVEFEFCEGDRNLARSEGFVFIDFGGVGGIHIDSFVCRFESIFAQFLNL
jgi:hypothetical protein